MRLIIRALGEGRPPLRHQPDPNDFQSSTETFLVRRYIYDKIFTKIWLDFFGGDMSQIVENALSCNVEESFKKILDPDPEADDCQNLIIFPVQSTDTSTLKFS